MMVFILVGIIALLVGIMYLVAPGMLIKLSALFNQIVSTDDKTMKYRISVGVVFVVLGLFFLFIAYYIANIH